MVGTPIQPRSTLFWTRLSKRGDEALTSAFDLTQAEKFMSTYLKLGSAAALRQWQAAGGQTTFALNYPASAPGPATGSALPDADMVATTSDLFGRYGTEIAAALLLSALPQAYASPKGAAVLANTQQLQNSVARRVAGTAQFVVDAISGTIDPTRLTTTTSRAEALRDSLWGRKGADPSEWGTAARATCGLRLLHQAIRVTVADRIRNDEKRVAPEIINQEDLLATLMLFTVGTFEVLERFGIAWTADEQQAYLYTWGHIGAAIGIDRKVIPSSVDDARRLAGESRNRAWNPSAGANGLDNQLAELANGRRLARALLAEIDQAMPARYRRWPAFVIRQLAPDGVVARLALGANGSIGVALDALPARHIRVDRFTAVDRPNIVGAAVLRLMANQVAQRVLLDLIKNANPPLIVPGLSPSVTSAVRFGR